MAAHRILQLGDPELREISRPVETPAAARPLLDNLRDTLHEFQRTHGFGRGISAIATKGGEHTYPIPAADGVQIDKDNEVILARSGKSVYAFALACPHQNTALRWDAGNNRFQCPKHKSKYRPDGTFIEGRATRSMDRYAVRLVGSSVAVDVDKLYQEDTDLTQWQHAVVSLP